MPDNSRDNAQRNMEAFRKLRGIAKELFKELGGGEAFIRKERREFDLETQTGGGDGATGIVE